MVPPIEFGDILDRTVEEPFLVAERGEELAVRVKAGDLGHSRVGEMVVMAMGYDNRIDYWDIGNFAGHFSISFRPNRFVNWLFEERNRGFL